MTKEEIINRIWERLEISKKEAAQAAEEVLNAVKEALANSDRVKIGGFGTFEVKQRKARMGRNPKTGEEALIKEGRTIKFKAGKPLKMTIADS